MSNPISIKTLISKADNLQNSFNCEPSTPAALAALIHRSFVDLSTMFGEYDKPSREDSYWTFHDVYHLTKALDIICDNPPNGLQELKKIVKDLMVINECDYMGVVA